MFFVPPGFAFALYYSNNKKAKDSGGGTPDLSGQGSIPCGVLLFNSTLCGENYMQGLSTDVELAGLL